MKFQRLLTITSFLLLGTTSQACENPYAISKPGSGDPFLQAQAAMEKLRQRLSATDFLAFVKPVSLGQGRIAYGSTGGRSNYPYAISKPWNSDPSLAAQVALQKLQPGQSEAEVLALMKPVALDYGKISYGGTGSGRLYFQLSLTHQIWVESEGAGGPVWHIGKPEP
jgi:hypothetical protein